MFLSAEKLLPIEGRYALTKGNEAAKVPMRQADELGERRVFRKVNRT